MRADAGVYAVVGAERFTTFMSPARCGSWKRFRRLWCTSAALAALRPPPACRTSAAALAHGGTVGRIVNQLLPAADARAAAVVKRHGAAGTTMHAGPRAAHCFGQSFLVHCCSARCSVDAHRNRKRPTAATRRNGASTIVVTRRNGVSAIAVIMCSRRAAVSRSRAFLRRPAVCLSESGVSCRRLSCACAPTICGDTIVTGIYRGMRIADELCEVTRLSVVILDEPTNHLDVAATQVMERALVYFPEAVIVVSHDRFFHRQGGHPAPRVRRQRARVDRFSAGATTSRRRPRWRTPPGRSRRVAGWRPARSSPDRTR